MEDFKLSILSDNPEEPAKVRFDFEAYKNTFVEIISGKQNETPLVIGIEGRWGRGKTTLMKAIRAELDGMDKKKAKDRRLCKTVWFQAWKYNNADNLLAALLESIVQEMGQGNFFERAEIGIKRVWDSLNLKAVPEFFADYLPILKGIAKVIKEEDYKKNLPYFNLFSTFLKQLIRLWIHAEESFRMTGVSEVKIGDIDDAKGVLVVFIDDLDRCDSRNIIKVLEAVKLFLDFRGCIFVMGVSKDVIVEALKSELKIGREYGEEYLEKMIQVSYELPLIHRDDMQEYFKEAVGRYPYKDILHAYADVIVLSLGDTPRKIKKFINNLNLQIKIADHKGLFNKEFGEGRKIEIKDYIHWNVLKEAYKEHYDVVKRNLDIIRIVKEEYARNEKEIIDKTFDMAKVVHEPSRKILQDEQARELILALPEDADILETLKYESMAAGTVRIEAANVKSAQKLSAYSIVGTIAKVPSGPFLYGDEKKERLIEYDFEIDVFPVTNDEYSKFLNERNPESEDLNKWIFLEYSRISKEADKYVVQRGFERHPVVAVSWHGADAYAQWAGKRLPTEGDWEKAARGPHGWKYPWGEEFEKEMCNTDEGGIGGTSEVDRFPNGKSFYGCYDMSGNVWEWTDSLFDKDQDSKVLRGGSWGDDSDYARCAYRSRLNPDLRFYFVGFRCARTLTL